MQNLGSRSWVGASLPLAPQSPPYKEHGVLPKLFFMDIVTPAIQWFFNLDKDAYTSHFGERLIDVVSRDTCSRPTALLRAHTVL